MLTRSTQFANEITSRANEALKEGHDVMEYPAHAHAGIWEMYSSGELKILK